MEKKTTNITAIGSLTSEPSQRKPGRPYIVVGQLIVGLGLLALLFFTVDRQELVAAIRHAHKGWLLFGWLWMISTFYLRAVVNRWIVAIDTDISTFHLFKLTLVGTFFSNFLPTQVGGDVIKGVYLFPHFNSRSHAMASVVFQRLIGIVATGLVTALVCSAILLEEGLHFWSMAMLISALVVSGAAISALKAFIAALRKRQLKLSFPGVHYFSKAYIAIARYAKHPMLMFKVFTASCLITCHGMVTIAIAAKAVGVDLSLLHAAVIGSFSQLSAVFAFTPGGLGISEAVFVVLGKAGGIGSTEALAYAIVVRAYQVGCGFLGGLIYLKLAKRTHQ